MTTAAAPLAAGRRRLLPSWLKTRNVVLSIAALALLLLVLCAVIPGVIAPHDPLTQNLADTLLRPGTTGTDGTYHLLGTDELGRDVLSRLIYGARISLIVGLGGAAVAALIGVPIGLTAGFRGGKLEVLVMRLVDALTSFPHLVLYIFLRYTFGGGIVSLVLVLCSLRWINFVRVSRALVLPYREIAFVEAARMVGCRSKRIVFRHILPNILAPLAVISALEVAALILLEASLSFLGLGVQPPTPSWGQMLSTASDYIGTSPWLIVYPGALIFAAMLSLNIIGRRLRTRLLREEDV